MATIPALTVEMPRPSLVQTRYDAKFECRYRLRASRSIRSASAASSRPS